MAKFEIKNKEFYYNNDKVKIISGTIHYFRTVPQYWEDRLLKLKACGFNTVETYVAWNIHEPKEGKFNFEGIADIERFIKIAQKLGLFVIVRPGPYICAEWDFGGIPGWVLKYDDIKLRCYNKRYLKKVDVFYDKLMPRLKPLLCTNDGPIIAVQIENEYGSYGNDKKYLNYLRQAMIDRGIDVLFFTSDGATDRMLQGGTLPDVFKTANFGSREEEAFKKLSEYEKEGPLMCMEYWIGWFDYWGGNHHKREPQDVADTFEKMLKMGANVNFYMFHGGTNFGFYNGANWDKTYRPTATTYDYDALLTEAGDLTEKYYAVKKVIKKYFNINDNITVKNTNKRAYGKVQLTEQAELYDSLHNLSVPVKCTYPLPMEKLGQNYGYILYRTKVKGFKGEVEVNIKDCHDRALVFWNYKYQGVIDRTDNRNENKVIITVSKEETYLDILVENMGRTNHGRYLGEYKGITEGVMLDGQYQYAWEIYPLPLDNLSGIKFIEKIRKQKSPCFYKSTFTVDKPADTFLLMEGWKKGVVYINEFNLGRYWEKGPQKTLYVPAPILKKGENEIIIFELHGSKDKVVEFVDNPQLS